MPALARPARGKRARPRARRRTFSCVSSLLEPVELLRIVHEDPATVIRRNAALQKTYERVLVDFAEDRVRRRIAARAVEMKQMRPIGSPHESRRSCLRE